MSRRLTRSFLRPGCLILAVLLAAKVTADQPLQVLTYNIRYLNRSDGEDIWENRRETVVNTIRQADVAGLQEVLAAQHDYIAEQTPGWQWYGVGRDDGLRRGEMTSIGWRTSRVIALEQGTFWLNESPYRVGKAGWDAALPRIASWVRLVPRRPAEEEQPSSLLLINTHFDHRGGEARRQSAALLRSWIAEHRGSSQVVLIGDLNARVGSPPLDELLRAEASDHPVLLDARDRAHTPDTGPDSTWNAFREIATGHRIDHILYQGDRIQVLQYLTLDPRTPAGRFASDHLPVMSEITF